MSIVQPQSLNLVDTLERIRTYASNNQKEHLPPPEQIIWDILESLGWNSYSSNISYNVPIYKNHTVNCVLPNKTGSRHLLIKAIPHNHLNNHFKKTPDLFKQATTKFESSFYVATTGYQWRCYLINNEYDNPQEHNFLNIDILDGVSTDKLATSFTEFLAKPALNNDETVELAKLYLEEKREEYVLKNELPKLWIEMLKNPDDKLLTILARRTSEELNIKAGKDTLIGILRSTAMKLSVSDQANTEKVKKPKSSTKKPSKRQKNPDAPIAYTLFGDKYEIKVHKKGLLHILETAYKNNPSAFDDLVNNERYITKEPDELSTPQIIQGSNIYVETHFNSKYIWKLVNKYMLELGYSHDDLIVHYSDGSNVHLGE